jgi:DNA-binding winged helix-turn-helix (wHTH) protein/tetratricopeptide (TPR) repeat protein
VLSFAGFELDRQRAELRGPDGGVIKLRPKTFDLLILFVGSPGRILSKQELMEAVWPNIHVGEDSLFQCIRELRTALGDDHRQIVKLVSGRGYMFEAEVVATPAAGQTNPPTPELTVSSEAAGGIAAPRFGLRLPIAAAVSLAAIVGLAVATPIFRPDISVKRTPVIAVMPMAEANQDPQTAAMAAAVIERLTDGLAKIDNIRVVAPNAGKQATPAELASASPADADYVVRNELSKGQQSWTLRTRMVKTATGEVEAIPALTVDDRGLDSDLLQTRLAAGIGHLLAVRINALVDADAKPVATDNTSRQGSAKVVIEQATASIMQTSRERFAAAQTMVEKALSSDPDNVDLEVAFAALQLRGVQMAWYNPEESIAAEKNAQLMLERALRVKPNNIPVLEAYCRFLNATNQFVESLVACARTLAFDPWDGMMLYHMGLAHIQLGRFEDALATFKQADRYDTPQVSRWTWLLGVGWSYAMMGRYEEAVPWLERSVAITPASGRPLILLAAAYQRLGRADEAKATLAKALQVRPGSTVSNIKLPLKNSSPAFLAASDKIKEAMVEAGLPDR